MGRNARGRLNRWQYRYDPGEDVYGYIRRGQPLVTLGPMSYASIMPWSRDLQLQNTVAHEEGHQIGLFHGDDRPALPTPLLALPTAEAVGHACRAGEGLVR